MSSILRRNLIISMLDVINDYKYCSTACHEAIEVLDILKVAFDDEDIETLKAFVKANLSTKGRTHLTFSSGRTATNANLATIIKIGIALKRITTSAAPAQSNVEDNEEALDSQSEEGEKQTKASGGTTEASGKSFRHLADSQWTQFVETKLNKFETKWTKKLETYNENDHIEVEEADPDEVHVVINGSDSDDDVILHDHHAGLSKSVQEERVESMFDQDLGAGAAKSKDDWDAAG
jgi:hypothetical protein